MNQQEQQFEEGLKALERNARECAHFAFIELTLHHRAGGDFAIFDRIQQDAAFWNYVLAALQTAAFVSMGRIYEAKTDTHSARDLLNFAQEHIGLFTRAAMEERKLRAGWKPEPAREFAASSVELQKGGLSSMVQAFNEHQQLYQLKVKDIRHVVFAHSGRRVNLHRLFAGLPVREFEKLAVFPLQMHRAIWQLFVNGIPPSVDETQTNIGEVLHALPGKSQSSWEHLHAAKDTCEFLNWLKTTALRSDD